VNKFYGINSNIFYNSFMKKKIIFSFAIGMLGAVLALAVGNTDFIQALERQTLDIKFRNFVRPFSNESNIVIIDINEDAIKDLEPDLGRWPWPREVHANLISYLVRDGAKVIAFDILFSERTARKEVDEKKIQDLIGLIDKIEQHQTSSSIGQLRSEINSLKPSAGDDALVRVSEAAGNVIYASIFTKSLQHYTDTEIENQKRLLSKSALSQTVSEVIGSKIISREAVFDDVTLPLSALALSSKGVAHINFNSDLDGPSRWTYPISGYLDILVPSLPIAACAAYLGVSVKDIKLEHNSLKIADRILPLDSQGRYHILFHNTSKDSASVSFVNVLLSSLLAAEGKPPLLPQGYFKNKLVFIGSSAAGLFDLRATPLSSITPGSEIHYHVASNILSNRFLRSTPSWFIPLLSVLLALLTSMIGFRLKPITSLIWTLLILSGYISFSILIFYLADVWLEIAVPSIAVALSYLTLLTYKYMTELREKNRIKSAFSRYLAPAVMEDILSDPSKLRLGGERRNVSVLFSDIKSFTTYSENIDPEIVSSMLNEYLTHMTSCVFRNHGILDKYIGDAVMAEFGAPIPSEDHAARACRTAIDMLSELEQLNEKWNKEGKKPFEFRIGINSGAAVVGNMGSDQLFDYTALGVTVNTAARLEPLCKDFGVTCLISETTKEFAEKDDSNMFFREIGRVILKGMIKPLKVFELVGLKNTFDELKLKALQLFSEGYSLYCEREFISAMQKFKEVLEISPKDGPSQIYLKLTEKFINSPPDKNWTGVYNQETK